MKAYDHKKIESKWQNYWEKKKIYKASDSSSNPKFYSLIEFPFPSGDGLHVGHIRSNAAMDIISRKRRMEGFNVLYPIGWDAFGLPTENYAIKTGVQPAAASKKNTDTFRRQLKAGGFSFDWTREINTTDPAYYKWTQWIFLQMHKAGLAYKAKMLINWCPKDKIGLANEEVVDGCCERCGTPVEKREKEQWMLGITKYADRLDKDLDTVDYAERIKIQQRNWIGKSEGAEVDFELTFKKDPKLNENRGPNGEKAHIKVFTTRPDTIFGATYVVLSPEHLWVTLATDDMHDVIGNKEEVRKYVAEAKKKTHIERTDAAKEKTGVKIEGVMAINPATKEEIPVYVADYVLADYGTGAVMAVPAHDDRDYDFAKKYNLPIKQVIEPVYLQTTEPGKIINGEPFRDRDTIIAIVKHWSDEKYIALKWKKVAWGTFVTGGIEQGQTPEEAARAEILEETGYKNLKLITGFGRVHGKFYHVPKKVNMFAHAHILLFQLENEEQVPVEAVEKENHEILWLSLEELKHFITPETHHYALRMLQHTQTAYLGEGILTNSGNSNGLPSKEAKTQITKAIDGKIVTKYKLRDWVFSRQRYWGEPIPMIHCDACKAAGRAEWVPVPEKELPVKLPPVKKYQPTDTGESPLAAISKWVNVKCPVCKSPAKRETDTMPNWAGSSWYYLRYADPKNKKTFADAKKLKHWTPVDWYNGGMEHTTLHLLYSRFWHKFLFDQGLVPTSEPYAKRTSHGLILAEGGVKMSKSKGNVINPDQIIATYGADTLRLYEMFMGPFEQPVTWNTDSIIGPRRFVERVWKLSEKVVPKLPFDADLESHIHSTIKKVSDDIEKMSFNTAVSALMILLNEMEKREKLARAYYEHFLALLAPFAPHVTEELWNMLGNKKSIHISPWPKHNDAKIKAGKLRIAIQVNGKVRAELLTEKTDEESIKKDAQELPEIMKWITDKKIIKIIYVAGKIVNIVTQ